MSTIVVPLSLIRWRIDGTRSVLEALVEIYRMMRPGRAADEGIGREFIPESVFLSRALRPVDRRADEVQSPPWARRQDRVSHPR